MFDDRDDYVTIGERARRLNCTEERVIALATRGVLRSYHDGVLWVEPELGSGAVQT